MKIDSEPVYEAIRIWLC